VSRYGHEIEMLRVIVGLHFDLPVRRELCRVHHDLRTDFVHPARKPVNRLDVA
jgi:hypothetical protein